MCAYPFIYECGSVDDYYLAPRISQSTPPLLLLEIHYVGNFFPFNLIYPPTQNTELVRDSPQKYLSAGTPEHNTSIRFLAGNTF